MASTHLLTALAIASTLLQPTAATCTSFQLIATYTGLLGESHGITHRMSTGYSCPAGTVDASRCSARGVPIQLALLPWFMPTNLSEATYAALYPVAGANITSSSWTERITGVPADAAGISIPLGPDSTENRTNGYMTFSPSYYCHTGALSGCDEEFEAKDGDAVRLCVPEVRREVNGTGYFSGATRWVETGPAEAEGLGEPQDYVQPPGNGSTLNPDPVPEETEDGEGVGVKGSPGVWLAAGMAMLSLAFVL